jgi:hypothetical protein
MDVPAIGRTRGVFEIFVPGAFLLINISGVLYILTQIIKFPDFIPKCIKYTVDHPGLGIVILICFGFLIGMILRLFMTDIPDLISAWYHRFFKRKKLIDKAGNYKPWCIEKFPYIEAIGEAILRDLCDRSSSIYDFYKKVWEPQKRNKGNKRFFNFCKTMLLTKDNDMIIMELYSAESINRYISGMFYSLAISVFLLSLLAIIVAILKPFSEIIIFLLIILFFYFIGLWNIISRFRLIRLKEAQLLFDACYYKKDLFLKIIDKKA